MTDTIAEEILKKDDCYWLINCPKAGNLRKQIKKLLTDSKAKDNEIAELKAEHNRQQLIKAKELLERDKRVKDLEASQCDESCKIWFDARKKMKTEIEKLKERFLLYVNYVNKNPNLTPAAAIESLESLKMRFCAIDTARTANPCGKCFYCKWIQREIDLFAGRPKNRHTRPTRRRPDEAYEALNKARIFAKKGVDVEVKK